MLNEEETWLTLEEYCCLVYGYPFDRQVSIVNKNFYEKKQKIDRKISKIINKIWRKQEKVQNILKKIVVKNSLGISENEMNSMKKTNKSISHYNNKIEKCFEEKLLLRDKHELLSKCIKIYHNPTKHSLHDD